MEDTEIPYDYCQNVGDTATLVDMDKEDLHILGLQEIAVLLDVQPRTPHMWNFRQLLPDPDYLSVNGARAWKRSTIVKWAAQTERLPDDLVDEGKRWIPKAVAV